MIFFLQCILGLLTGLLIVKVLYKTPAWLHSSRLNLILIIAIVIVVILLICIRITIMIIRAQLVMASLFLITSSLAAFSLLLWAGFDPNW